MTATARLLAQRSIGHVHVRMERDGIAVLREAGAAKCRVPPSSTEAILINTSGGLAGGDTVHIKAEAATGAELTLTSQTAERIYRTLGPAADVHVNLTAGPASRLSWLPQESIFFEGSALTRRLDVDLAHDAQFLALESMVFGRTEMGEQVVQISVEDRWNIRRCGKLMHVEAFKLGPQWPKSAASFASHRAMATLLWVSPQAEAKLDNVRAVLGPSSGASAWNGKLVARLLETDGFQLRKILFQVLVAVVGRENLPKCWTL